LLNLPLPHALHVVAPFVLDSPGEQFVQDALGGSLPIVPAGHAVNPLPVESDESILEKRKIRLFCFHVLAKEMLEEERRARDDMYWQ